MQQLTSIQLHTSCGLETMLHTHINGSDQVAMLLLSTCWYLLDTLGSA